MNIIKEDVISVKMFQSLPLIAPQEPYCECLFSTIVAKNYVGSSQSSLSLV